MKRRNIFLSILKIALINQIIFIPSRGLSQDCLRPTAAARSHTAPIIFSETKASSAGNNLAAPNRTLTGTQTVYGDGTSPEKTVPGRTAIASSHDPGDIIRSVRREDIPAELDSFEKLIEGTRQSIERAYTKDSLVHGIALGYLGTFHRRVKKYLEGHKRDKAEGLIRDSASQLKLLLSTEKEVAGSFQDTDKVIALTFIEMEMGKRAIKPLVRLLNPHKPTEEERQLIEQRAKEEWQRFIDVRDKMVSMYKELAEEGNAKKAKLKEKQEGLKLRINNLRSRQKEFSGRKQERAIIENIKREERKIEKIEEDIKNTDQAALLFSAYASFVSEITKVRSTITEGTVFKGTEGLARQNRSVSDILYNLVYLDLETQREAYKEGDKFHQIISDYMRILEELIGHLHGVDPFYLKAPAEKEELVIFTDEEIGVPALSKLMAEHKIRGIASRDGTVTSHSSIVASQKKIPVVILKGLKEQKGRVSDIVNAGDEIILETKKEEGQSAVITRPDEATKKRYSVSRREKELYHKLCLDSIPGIRSEDRPLLIYGNAAEPEEVLDIINEKGYGIGLVRTEIYLKWLAPLLNAYIQAHSAKREVLKKVHREEFLIECSSAMLEYFKIFKEQKGPLTIRTFDITWDKNKDILKIMPEGQRQEGFGFYKTEIGREILIIQIAAIIHALYMVSGEEESYSFKPRIIFPAVQAADDMRWIFKEVLPVGMRMARERITAEIRTKNGRERMSRRETEQFRVALRNLKYGLMVETAEVVDSIKEIVSDPRVSVLSVGTNDLISRILSRAYGFDVLRGDEHDEHYFFELSPEVLRVIEDVAKAIKDWNDANPNNKKTLGICGELASREKFLLFALYLENKYHIPIYLSMPSESMPVLEYFASFVEPQEISVFEEIDEGTDAEAVEKVEQIYGRIRSGQAYQQEVRDAMVSEEEFFNSRPKPIARPEAALAAITAISQSA